MNRPRRPCTNTEHDRIVASPARFASECERHRRWSSFGLVIAEHDCGSTLSMPLDEAVES